jgi:hypothetical protein
MIWKDDGRGGYVKFKDWGRIDRNLFRRTNLAFVWWTGEHQAELLVSMPAKIQAWNLKKESQKFTAWDDNFRVT